MPFWLDQVRALFGKKGTAPAWSASRRACSVWYQRARTMMMELGFRKSRLAPCKFSMRGRNRRREPSLKALVSLHVDMTPRRCGNSSKLASHCLRTLCQEDDFVITIDMDSHLKDVQCVSINKDRAGDDALTQAEFAPLRKLVGRLGYAAKNGRHDIAFGTPWCQQSLQGATVSAIRGKLSPAHGS